MPRGYWWIQATDPDTEKPYLIKGGPTEAEAREKGLESLSGIDFELTWLPTTNISAASRMIKGGKLEVTGSLRQAAQRIGHDKSLRRRNREDFL